MTNDNLLINKCSLLIIIVLIIFTILYFCNNYENYDSYDNKNLYPYIHKSEWNNKKDLNQLIIFLTHNFKSEFMNTLLKVDNDPNINYYDVIILFDNTNTYDKELIKFKNIKIIEMNKDKLSYDSMGHSMYVNYFRKNYDQINKYDYVWVIENDVYYPSSLLEFINNNTINDYDLLVGEYGMRSPNWEYPTFIKGFKKIYNIGVLAVIVRFSKKFLHILIDNIDIKYFGSLEAILPHICFENNLSLNQFTPESCGLLTTVTDNPFLKLIESDIINNTKKFIENKLYHPIKL
jgi:hypothetical protein